MADILAWYLALVILGLAGLMPAALLFDRLDSRGVYVARPLALALVALMTYLVVALTPIPYGTPMVLGSIGLLLGVTAFFGWRRPDLVRDLGDRGRSIVTGEAVFLLVFVLVLFARVHAPDAWATEKPADLMLMTAVHHATEFPPPDPWLAGERISYYLLGQLQMDHVARLTGLGPSLAFNLSVATAGAAAAVAAFGVAMDIARMGTRRRGAAIGGAVAVLGLLLAAPLVGVVQILAANGLGGDIGGALGVEGVPVAEGARQLVPEAFWWWWPTTRIIPGGLNEYPAFTLLLGDPHAHLFALPLGLTALGLAVQVFEGFRPLTWRRWLVEPERLVLTAALFAALVMTNSWDVITFGAIWAGAAWWVIARTGWPGLLAGFIAARWAAVPAVLGVILALPFLRTLDTNPMGVVPVLGEHSDPTRALLLWLPALLPALAAIAVLRPRSRRLPRALLVAALPVAAWVAALLATGEGAEVVDRVWGWLTLAALVAGIAWCASAALAAERSVEGDAGVEGIPRRGEPPRVAALALLAAGLAVLLVVELVHVDDAFLGRWNTSFKFWFHAWAIFAVAGGALVGVALGEGAGRRGAPWRPGLAIAAACGVLWLVTMMTPPAMAVSRAREGQASGLSATAYLERQRPGLAAAAQWARGNLDPERDVLVQAIGEAYSTGNFLASLSGVPTLLGWPGHERQWRGDIREAERRAAVQRIYAGTPADALEAARAWEVTHVYVGDDERRAFGSAVASRFEGWPVAFEAADAVIFRVPSDVGGGS